jgi:hypothetical protein
MAFTGGFAVAAMANSQAMVDAFGTELKKIKDTYWFTFALTPCYLITLTGNQWRNDLKEKQDSTRSAIRNGASGVSDPLLHWKCIGNRKLSISGFKPGYSFSLTTLSGKLLHREPCVVGKTSYGLPAGEGCCAVITVRNKNGIVQKTGLITLIRER